MNAMSEAISERRMVVCAVVVAIFAAIVYFAVQWRACAAASAARVAGRRSCRSIEAAK